MTKETEVRERQWKDKVTSYGEVCILLLLPFCPHIYISPHSDTAELNPLFSLNSFLHANTYIQWLYEPLNTIAIVESS